MQLSSPLTFFWKFLFTGIFIISPVFDLMKGLWRWTVLSEPLFDNVSLFGLILFALISVVLLYSLGRLKSVSLEGETLIVSNYYRKIQIPLTHVRYVDGPDMTSHRCITIWLKPRSTFGDRIVFTPGFFHANSTADQLRMRVHH